MKKWYKSKTFWWNAAAVVVAGADYFAGRPFSQHNEVVSEVFGGIVAVGNIILRFKTSTALTT